MNNYPYFMQQDLTPIIIDELKKINETLRKIEKKLDKEKINNYLEKDDNYYII